LRLAFLADPNSVHTRRWLGWFAERGHEVHLVVDEGLGVRPGLDPRILVSRYRRFRPMRLPFVSSLQGGAALRGALRGVGPDVIHAHYLVGYGWQARLAGMHPYDVTPWGSDLFVAPMRSWRARLWNRLTLRDAKLVTVNSPHMGRVAVDAGAQPGRVVEIQFGVSTSAFTPGTPDLAVLERLGVAVDRPLLVSLRALAPLYRHELVIEAMAQLPPEAVVLFSLRNADLAYVDRLRERARALGVEDRLRFADDLDETQTLALLRAAVASISVPLSDALPVTVLEAMSCGCPPVVGDLPPLRALLSEVAPQLVVSDGDVTALAERLRALLELPAAERQRLGASLRRHAVEHYDRDANMTRMEELYLRLAVRGAR
jgi:glycosyltransferase involved in cell wall biosynthesis